jgi:PAS domain S-box-containing protein
LETAPASPTARGWDAEATDLDRVEHSAGIGFWDFDTFTWLVRWSFGMEAIYGLPKGSFKGTPEDFVSRIHPDDTALVLRETQTAIDTRLPFDIPFRILRPDGTVRWVASRGAARFGPDGTFRGSSGFQIDITEPKQREEQLKLQSQIITSMAEGVLLVDANNVHILYANPRFEAMLGYSPGALHGLPVADINGRTGQDPQAVADAIKQEMRCNGSWRGEVKNRCADGREIWTSSTVTEMHYEGLGKVWIAVHHDITERRQAEAARDEAIVQLQRLSRSVQDQIEAERTAVSREVHDQLGAALTGLRMQLEALAGKLHTLAPALGQEAMALVAQAAQTQRDARDLCSRLRPALLDDKSLTEACRWYAKEWSRQSGIAVKTRFSALAPEPNSTIATDMFRVLQELLTNVARHSGARNVRIALAADRNQLVLKVDDDGYGMATLAPAEGFGLIGIRERLRHHGGMLRLRSDASGARITATMQLGGLP